MQQFSTPLPTIDPTDYGIINRVRNDARVAAETARISLENTPPKAPLFQSFSLHSV